MADYLKYKEEERQEGHEQYHQRVSDTGADHRENDRLVTLLTADHGLVRAFVRGGKQLKNRRAAATSLFAMASLPCTVGATLIR